MYAVLMRKLSSVVRQLAERHARLKGEVERLDNLLADVARDREKLQAQADATGLLLHGFDHRVDFTQIGSIAAYKGRYGEHGALKAAVLRHVRAASPGGITVGTLLLLLRHQFDLDLPTPGLVANWVASSLWPQLRRLAEEGTVVKFKTGPRRNDPIFWHAPSPASAGSLDDLRAEATVAGLATTS